MKIAYLFPGQGSQHVGMGQDYYQEPAARAVFDLADAQLGYALSDLCFNGPEMQLTDTRYQQPALFVTSMAAWAVMQARGWPVAHAMAGHSLGELTALTAAGALTFADGLALVQKRGELMHKAGELAPGKMAAFLALTAEQVADICTQATATVGQIVQIANDNCPGQIVVSGSTEAVAHAMMLSIAAGSRKSVELPITIAAHSPLMQSVADEFALAVTQTEVTSPHTPVIANTTATPMTTPEEIRAELTRQLTHGVLWTTSMQLLGQDGVDTYIEVGAGEVLTGLMKRIERQSNRLKFALDTPIPA